MAINEQVASVWHDGKLRMWQLLGQILSHGGRRALILLAVPETDRRADITQTESPILGGDNPVPAHAVSSFSEWLGIGGDKHRAHRWIAQHSPVWACALLQVVFVGLLGI